MIGILPVAGKGTRIGKFTEYYPKALYPYKNVPLLYRNIEWLLEQGCEMIIVVGHHKSNYIKKALEDYYSPRIFYTEQENLNGSLYAVEQGLSFAAPHEKVLILFGDLLPIAHVYFKGNTLSVAKVDDWERWVMVEAKADNVVRLIEKPKDKPNTTWSWSGIAHVDSAFELRQAIMEVTANEGETCLSKALEHLHMKIIEVPIINFGTEQDCKAHSNPDEALEFTRRKFDGE